MKKIKKVTFETLKSHIFFPPISTPFFALLGSFFPMGLIGRSIQILTTFCHFLHFFRSIYPNLAPLPPKNQFYPNLASTKNPLFCKISIFFIFFYPDPPLSIFWIQSRPTKIKKLQKSEMYRYLDPKKIKSGDFRKKKLKKMKKIKKWKKSKKWPSRP
jgi:hypothetical protein